MKFGSIARINFTVVALSVAAVLFSSVIGAIPDERVVTVGSRAKLAEAIAANVSFLVSKHEYQQIEFQLDLFAKRTPDLLSAGLRRASDNAVLASTGNHATRWQEGIASKNDGCYTVPILANQNRWGVLEIQFSPAFGGSAFWFSPTVLRLLFILVPLVGLASWLHLKRILQYLDPSKAIPPRVRQTLDSFAEGVVLLNAKERIVLANDAFANLFGLTAEELVGSKMDNGQWERLDATPDEKDLPWEVTCTTFQAVQAQTVRFQPLEGPPKIFSVNASPVLDEQGKFQGVMVAFADVTPLEQKRAELATTLEELNESKDAITKQNEELRFLATRDPLTSCINRRTFFEQFDNLFNFASTNGSPMCAVMVDIDFFKSINDTYGHGMGDEVLRETGRVLNESARPEDVVCRYGGEEFSLLMPNLSLDDAFQAAERIRIRLSELEFPEFSITASLGLSEVALGAASPQDLLDQADKCLYVAKRNGRNQVVRFDSVPEDLVVDESTISREKPAEEKPSDAGSIPFAAVTALLAALSYRDSQTGAHSNRVSHYSALLAQSFLGPSDVYIIEIAALLHDIGKIGVPDAILLKPGRLNKEEWEIMERHDRVGVEIISKSFKHPTLTKIVEYHHCRYDGSDQCTDLSGEDIPIGARILTITDSFDAMVSDRPYRKGMPISDAIQELRRCAGTQFDPVLVERFCDLVEAGHVQPDLVCHTFPDEVMLNIGEQIERIAEAADQGDRKAFVALTERLKETAARSNLQMLTEVAEKTLSGSEDAELDQLVQDAFELLAVCRSMRSRILCDAPSPSKPSAN